MQFAKKMSLVPYQEGDGVEEFVASSETATPVVPVLTTAEPVRKTNSIRKYAMDRQTKMLNVILKLAQKKCYDGQAMISLDNGERFSILPLLAHCFSPGRSVRGLEHFVELMHEAGVSPDDVINQSVKEQLMMMRRSPETTRQPIEEQASTSSQPKPRKITRAKRRNNVQTIVDNEAPRALRSSKRKNDSPDEQPEKVQKTVDWSVDDSDLDDNE